MENRINSVIDDVKTMCKEANITEPTNIIHFLIAYLISKEDKSAEDYAVNSVVACLISEIVKKMKNQTITLTKEELLTICNSFMINGVKNEIKIDEKLENEKVEEEPIVSA